MINGLTDIELKVQVRKYVDQGYKHTGLGIMEKGQVRLKLYKDKKGNMCARMLDFCAIQGDLRK